MVVALALQIAIKFKLPKNVIDRKEVVLRCFIPFLSLRPVGAERASAQHPTVDGCFRQQVKCGPVSGHSEGRLQASLVVVQVDLSWSAQQVQPVDVIHVLQGCGLPPDAPQVRMKAVEKQLHMMGNQASEPIADVLSDFGGNSIS